MSAKNKVGRPPGTPRTGGRLKGTPNKTEDQRLNVWKTLAHLDYDAIDELVTVARKEGTTDELRVRIAEGFMRYIYPQRKAIEFVDDTEVVEGKGGSKSMPLARLLTALAEAAQ